MATIAPERIVIGKEFPDDTSVRYIAHHNGEEIGYIDSQFYPDSADLEDITVYPDYRGNRIASALFRSFMQDVRDKGIKEISAAISNERSAQLMASLDTEKLTFDHEGEPLHDMTMASLINRLQKAREKEQERRRNMRDDDKITTLAVRLTAHLK